MNPENTCDHKKERIQSPIRLKELLHSPNTVMKYRFQANDVAKIYDKIIRTPL